MLTKRARGVEREETKEERKTPTKKRGQERVVRGKRVKYERTRNGEGKKGSVRIGSASAHFP